jgi:predicted metalloprotease with PDZ domain
MANMPDAQGDAASQLLLLLRQMQSGAVGMVVNDGAFSFKLVGRPVETTSAEDLASVLKGVVAIVKMQPDIPAEFASIMNDVEIAARDGFVTIDLTLSAEATAALLASMQE